MILLPLLSPQHYLLQVALQIFRRVAPEHVDDFIIVRLQSLLVDHLEDFTLHVVLQLFPRVSPDRRGEKTPQPRHDYSSRKSDSVARISGTRQQRSGPKGNVPALQARVQLGVMCAKDKYNIEPALGEEVTPVVVHNHAPLGHLVFELVHHLRVHRVCMRRARISLQLGVGLKPQLTCGESKGVLCFLSPALCGVCVGVWPCSEGATVGTHWWECFM